MYHLRNFHIFQTENPISLKYGLDAIPYCASQLWQELPIENGEVASLALFKNCIKTWKCEDCPCRSCKIFIQNVGYIWLGPITDRNISVNCSICMRHICIYKFIVNHWNAVYSLWYYSHTGTVLFFVVAVVVVAWTSSELCILCYVCILYLKSTHKIVYNKKLINID